MILTRRQWLWLASAFGAVRLLSKPSSGFLPEPLFAEVPASASGIEWVHDNAMSPSRYLPETLGPGCAFLDYDNDGWMDILPGQQRPVRFLEAAEAAAQRAVQEQSRRHVHRRDGKGGRGGRHVRHGRGGRATTTTTAGPTCS